MLYNIVLVSAKQLHGSALSIHMSPPSWTPTIEEEKLKFYITSCSFRLCNSACSLRSLYHVGLRKWGITILSSVQFSHSVVSDSLWPHESQHARPPCLSPSPGVHSDSRPLESVMPSSHLILSRPLLLLPPIPPSIRVFSNESNLCIRWPKYWSFSFSISPSKDWSTQDWSPLEWISLQSKGLSRVFSSTTVQKHQFFGAQLSSQSNSRIHTWPLEKS